MILFYYVVVPRAKYLSPTIYRPQPTCYPVFTENKPHDLTRVIKCGMILVQAGRQLKSESSIGGKSPLNHCFQLPIIILS